MPMHDWTQVDAGIFHALHAAWIVGLAQSLNRMLPRDYYALPEQHAGEYRSDEIALERTKKSGKEGGVSGNGASVKMPQPRPKAHYVIEATEEAYVQKQNRIAIRHVSGDDLVAVVEILSPGNKASNGAFQQLMEKMETFLEHRVHLLIVDPFPPTSRDPQGIHASIWQDRSPGDYRFDAAKPLTLVSYQCALVTRAYVEPFAVGDALKPMPVYLDRDLYVEAPLEETYQAAFAAMPERREVIDADSA